MEHITCYARKSICNIFEIKNVSEHHDLYVQSDVLLPPDIFKNFCNMCVKIKEFHPVHFPAQD